MSDSMHREGWIKGKATAFMVSIKDAFSQVITSVIQIQLMGLKATS